MWSGGTYTKGNSATGGWTGDASLGIGIEAGRHDTQDNDFATGINQCLNKDGSNAATGNLNIGGYKVTNVATATVSTDVVTLGQAQAGIDESTTTTTITSTKFSADADGRILQLQKSRGATVGTNTIVQSGDTVGGVAFAGANGTGYTQAASILALIDGTPGATNDMPGRLSFRTTADAAGTTSERMRIDNAGNISTGGIAPAVNLHVHQPTAGQNGIIKITNSGTGITATDGFDLAVDASTNAYLINRENTNMYFYTNNTERMRIANNGNVSVGTTATPYPFVVYTNGTNIVASQIYVNAASSTGTPCMEWVKYDNNSTTANIFQRFFINQGASGSGQINANGASAAAFGSFSDIRLKENIVDLPSQLAAIRSLRPVEFDYRDGSGHQIGFIAQEVEQIYPDLVGIGDKDMLTLTDLNKNDARLIKAFQELAAKVDELEARVAELEA